MEIRGSGEPRLSDLRARQPGYLTVLGASCEIWTAGTKAAEIRQSAQFPLNTAPRGAALQRALGSGWLQCSLGLCRGEGNGPKPDSLAAKTGLPIPAGSNTGLNHLKNGRPGIPNSEVTVLVASTNPIGGNNFDGSLEIAF
jgi:hypothetical protein